jgi:hypothetical protein
MSARVRSIRLNTLLKMYNRGIKDYDTLYKKCMTWGVTKQTAKGYLDALEALISKQRRVKY